MKIGLVAFYHPEPCYEERRILEVGTSLGHDVVFLPAEECFFVQESGKKSPEIFFRGKPLEGFDVFLVRPSVVSEVDARCALIAELELLDVPVFNSFTSIIVAKNKISTFRVLSRENLPFPKTVIFHSLSELSFALRALESFPVVVKLPFGTWGSGVYLVKDEPSLFPLVSQLFQNEENHTLLLQEFIAESDGTDIRVFVIGEKVFGAMMRRAPAGEFRSNIALGGTGEKVEISEEEKRIALAAMRALGLDFAGVDLIRSQRGSLILEVNSNPGFEAFEKVTGVDIARGLVEFLSSKS